MVSSVSSHSRRISFLAILALFIRIFAFLLNLILQSFYLSSIFIYLTWCICFNFFFYFLCFSLKIIVFLFNFICLFFLFIIFSLFLILVIICFNYVLSGFYIVNTGSTFLSGVIFLAASSFCEN